MKGHVPAFYNLLEFNSCQNASGSCLQSCYDQSQTVISHLLQETKQPSFEEHLHFVNSLNYLKVAPILIHTDCSHVINNSTVSENKNICSSLCIIWYNCKKTKQKLLNVKISTRHSLLVTNVFHQYLGVSQFVLGMVYIQGSQKLL